jgi:hypothetical protein
LYTALLADDERRRPVVIAMLGLAQATVSVGVDGVS